MKLTLAVFIVVSGISICATSQAAKPIAPRAPWSPNADKMIAQWSKLFKKHLTKVSSLQSSCSFPSASEVGVKAYPGSLVVNMAHGGGAVADSEDVPMVELVTKAPLKQVVAWYKQHYPGLKAKRMFETAGPGISYLTTNEAQYKHHPSDTEVEFEGGLFGGCGGLLQAPVAYQTGVNIYYQPHNH